jgi:crotonobetainyl-CoA:carnitine CoA-transferase CaiB-like acyl-CoA transferase
LQTILRVTLLSLLSYNYQLSIFQFEGPTCELTMPAPCLGQHNEYVLKEILGMSDDEVADLLIAGALE